MSRSDHEIRRAFRRASATEFLGNLRAAPLLITMIVAGMAASAYWLATPKEHIKRASGEVLGVHHEQTETGRGRDIVSIRLDDDRLVNVKLDAVTPYNRGAVASVDVFRRAWWPHLVTYRFAGYQETALPAEP